MTRPRLGFVGIGFMGRGMAKNLITPKKPFKYQNLGIYDSNPSNEAVKLLQEQAKELAVPMTVASSVHQLAKESDLVCMSLPNEAICADVVDELIAGFNAEKKLSPILYNWDIPPDTPIIVDHGTFSREFSLRTAEKAKLHGVKYVDAPVSGGPQGALDGTLTIMLGGDERICESIRPLLHSYAHKIMYFGPAGSGTAAKLVNQALVCMHAQAACEALFLAEKVGLSKSPEDTARLLSMLKASWGHSKVLELVLQDYIGSYVVDSEGTVRPSMEVEGVRNSVAPLRNLAKDLECVMREVGGGGGEEGSGSGSGVGAGTGTGAGAEAGAGAGARVDDSARLPLLSATSAALTTACGERGLKDSAFVSLLELITDQKK